MNRIVIDTDPGVDDAHAIMLACAHPTAKVEALMTVAGNVSLERATRNALIILDVIGQDVPVFAGCDDALVRPTPLELVPGQQVLAQPDPLALAVALEPDIVQRAETRHVEIELAGEFTRGQTVVDWYGLIDRPHNANLVFEINRDRLWELLQLSLR